MAKLYGFCLSIAYIARQCHVCTSCKRRVFTVEKKLFILELLEFQVPYLTEGVRHGLSKRSFPGTDRHRSRLGCNDLHVSIMKHGPDHCSFRCPTKKWGVCACASSRYRALFRGLGTRLACGTVISSSDRVPVPDCEVSRPMPCW